MINVRADWARRYQRLAAGRNYFRGLALAGLLAGLAAMLWGPAKAEDLAGGDPVEISQLMAEWHTGDVIVLVRHLERCSRVDAACLGPETGITARSVQVGATLAEAFRELGLGRADIFNSPLARTAQTAELLFDGSVEQDWLYQCEDDFLQAAMQRKAPGRNLILVTHSSCMDESEESLQLADVEFDYGTALFISVGEHGRKRALGYIDAADWDLVFGS